jgi:hypothetical protein
MVAYYERLAKGGGRADALRDALLAPMSDKAHSHPYFWASFIASGDVRALDGKSVKATSSAPGASGAVVPPSGRACACELERGPAELPWAPSWIGLAIVAPLARRARRLSARTLSGPRRSRRP